MKFDEMKVGVIGAGYWGIKHVEEYSQLGVNITACDKDEKRLELCNEKYQTTTVTDYHDILSDEQIKAISICTPNQTHYRIAKECLEAGKNVLVEKPLAMTVKEAQELVDIARDNENILAVGHIFRFNNAINKIKKIIDNGDLGEIRIVKIKWTNIEQLFDDRDVIFDLAPHSFDIINYLFGRDPDEVSCVGNAYRRSHDPEAVFINCRLDRTIINIELSWLTPPKTRYLTVVGSEKSVIVNATAQKIKVVDTKGEYDLNIIPNNTIQDELSSFLECIIDKNKISIAGGDIAVTTIKMIEITQRALKEKRTLKLKWS